MSEAKGKRLEANTKDFQLNLTVINELFSDHKPGVHIDFFLRSQSKHTLAKKHLSRVFEKIYNHSTDKIDYMEDVPSKSSISFSNVTIMNALD